MHRLTEKPGQQQERWGKLEEMAEKKELHERETQQRHSALALQLKKQAEFADLEKSQIIDMIKRDELAKELNEAKAAEIANEGITLEYESGADRSTLDVIQSNSLLLNARISLANSERNFLLSQYKLLSSIGRLTGSRLGLN